MIVKLLAESRSKGSPTFIPAIVTGHELVKTCI